MFVSVGGVEALDAAAGFVFFELFFFDDAEGAFFFLELGMPLLLVTRADAGRVQLRPWRLCFAF